MRQSIYLQIKDLCTNHDGSVPVPFTSFQSAANKKNDEKANNLLKHSYF